MAIEVGRSFYFMVHAYHHWIGIVESIDGKRSCTLRKVVRVQGCRRTWTEFFEQGFLNDTNYTVWPNGLMIHDWYACVPWPHEIPTQNAPAA